MTIAPPPTTPPTVAHDSSTCRLGLNNTRCLMCQMAEDAEMRRIFDRIGFSAIAIRSRRAALLERADAESPTEGAVALADAYLQVEEWFQRLPDNAAQDAAVLELAGRIETTIGDYLRRL